MKSGIEIIENRIPSKLREIALQMDDIEGKALKRAAYVMRENIKKALISVLPKATEQNPKYNDRLVDGVVMTKPKNGMIYVHILGIRDSKSGTYRLRFFEGRTKDRYQKGTLKPKKDFKKKRFTGYLDYKFFNDGVSRGTSPANKMLFEELDKRIQAAWANNNYVY